MPSNEDDMGGLGDPMSPQSNDGRAEENSYTKKGDPPTVGTLGDPMVPPSSASPDEEPNEKREGGIVEPKVTRREGEIEFSVPEPNNAEARSMSDAEKNLSSQIDKEDEQARIDQILENLTRSSSSLRLPRSLRKLCMFVLVGLAAIILLLVLGQVTSAVSKLAEMPVWSRWVIGIMLAVVASVLLIIVFRLLNAVLRLKKNEQINLTGLRELGERQELQEVAGHRSRQASKKLIGYLNNYPIGAVSDLLRAGLLKSEIDSLKRWRARLLEDSEVALSETWIERFHLEFQSVLDLCAKRRITGYARKAGIKTAISPMPLLDNAIILTISLSMVRDLMTIYNLRASSGGSVQILIRAIAQTYLAGEMQDITEALSDSLFENMGEHVGQALSRVGKFVGSKTGEGVVNGLLVRRLGIATVLLLQPTNTGKRG